MHSPSPRLLRALRGSLASTTLTSFRAPLATTSIPAVTTSRRHNSNNSNNKNNNTPISQPRPARLISRSHLSKPTSHDRGPRSSEDTQTDFASLNVLGNIPTPATAVDACLDDGFQLDNGARVTRGDGVLLVGGEAFAWRPWEAGAETESGYGSGSGSGGSRGKKAGMVNAKGQFEVDETVWGLLSLVWPRPDLLVIGLGATMFPLSPETKRHINSLGIRVEVQDTRNAAAQFNLLATERGVSEVAAALIPVGWRKR